MEKLLIPSKDPALCVDSIIQFPFDVKIGLIHFLHKGVPLLQDCETAEEYVQKCREANVTPFARMIFEACYISGLKNRPLGLSDTAIRIHGYDIKSEEHNDFVTSQMLIGCLPSQARFHSLKAALKT